VTIPTSNPNGSSVEGHCVWRRTVGIPVQAWLSNQLDFILPSCPWLAKISPQQTMAKEAYIAPLYVLLGRAAEELPRFHAPDRRSQQTCVVKFGSSKSPLLAEGVGVFRERLSTDVDAQGQPSRPTGSLTAILRSERTNEWPRRGTGTYKKDCFFASVCAVLRRWHRGNLSFTSMPDQSGPGAGELWPRARRKPTK